MKRTPLPRRKKPLARGKPPKRSKKPISRSGKRLVRQALRPRRKGKSRFPKRRQPEYKAWIKTLPCVLRGRTHPGGELHSCNNTPVEPAHVKSQGAGADDYGQLVPLDAMAHSTQHMIGIKSWAKYWFGENGIAELRRIAAEVYPKMYERSLALGFPE